MSRAATGKLTIEPSAIDLVEVVRASAEIDRADGGGPRRRPRRPARRGALRSVGRRRASPARVLERALERHQVHGPRRPGRRAPCANRRARRVRGGRHWPRHSPRLPSSCLRSVPAGRQLDDARRGRPRTRARDREAHRRTPRRDGERAEPRRGVRRHVHHRASRPGVASGPVVGARTAAEAVVRRVSLAREATETVQGLSGIRVLVCDDDEEMRQELAAALATARASTRDAPGGCAALDAFREFSPHVFVAEIGGPHAGGHELIAQIRSMHEEEGGQTPAIALSAHVGREDELTALARGLPDPPGQAGRPAQVRGDRRQPDGSSAGAKHGTSSDLKRTSLGSLGSGGGLSKPIDRDPEAQPARLGRTARKRVLSAQDGIS